MSTTFETRPRYEPMTSGTPEAPLAEGGPVATELDSMRRMRSFRWLVDAATVAFVLLIAGVIALPFVMKSQ